MARSSRTLVSVVAVALLASSCGGGGQAVAPSSSSSTSATVTVDPTTTADAEVAATTTTLVVDTTATTEAATPSTPAPEEDASSTTVDPASSTTAGTSASTTSAAATTAPPTTLAETTTSTTTAGASTTTAAAEPEPPTFDLRSAFRCVSGILGHDAWHTWRRRAPTADETARTADCPAATHDLRCVDRTLGLQRSDQVWLGSDEPTAAELEALEPCRLGTTDDPTQDTGSAAGTTTTAAPATTTTAPPAELVGVLRSVRTPEAAHRAATETGCSTMSGDRCTELSWEQVGPLRNGGVAALAVAPTDPNVVYAGFDANDMSFWRSDDAGATWQQVHASAHTSSIAVDPTDASTVLYSVIEGWVYRSDTGGTSPDQVMDRRNTGDYRFGAVAYAPGDRNVAYAAATGTREGGEQRGRSAVVLASGDGGRNWREVGSCGGCGIVHAIAVDPADARSLVAATEMGIRTSSDGGATWSSDRLPRLGWGDNVVLDVQFRPHSSTHLLAATFDHGVLRSTDGGTSWTRSNDGLTDTMAHEVRFAPNAGDVAYVTTHDGVFRTDDGGRTWEPRSGGLDYRYVHAIAVDPRDPDVAYVGTASELNQLHAQHMQEGLHRGEGLFKTTDGGRTWTLSDSGIEESRMVMVTPHPVRPYEVWTGASAGRSGYLSIDAGSSWAVSSTRASHYPMVSAWSSTFPSVQYLSSLSSRVELIRSADEGHTWTSLSDALGRGVSARSRANGQYDESRHFHAHTHGLAVAPSDPDVVYAGTISHPSQFEQYTLDGAHIFRSTDGGDTFTEVDEGFPTATDTSINAIVIHPTNADIVYVMTSSYESIEGIGIYRSTDGGDSWQAINDGLDLETNDLQIDPVDPRILYAATASGVYRTTDGGDSWHLRSNGIFDGFSGFPTRREREVVDLAIDPVNPNVLYATGFKGVYRTKDGGENWYVANGDLPVESWRGHGAFGHDRNIEVDATGQVVYVLLGTRKPDNYDPVRMYRAVLGTPEARTWTFAAGGRTITVETTSHLSGLVVDLERDRVRFVAAGPGGTEARTTVTIPSEFVDGPAGVTVDGISVPATIDGQTITFAYPHDGEGTVVVR